MSPPWARVLDGLMVCDVFITERNFSNIDEVLCVLLYRLVTKNSPQHLTNNRMITLKKRDDDQCGDVMLTLIVICCRVERPALC